MFKFVWVGRGGGSREFEQNSGISVYLSIGLQILNICTIVKEKFIISRSPLFTLYIPDVFITGYR